MSTLTIYRGLPGSGKTTHAKAWVAKDPAGRARINRDDLRAMLHGGYRDASEPVVIAVRDALIQNLLRSGVDVACDDTNLPADVVTHLAALARAVGAGVAVHDLTGVSLEDCVARDFARGLLGGRTVGRRVIAELWSRYEPVDAAALVGDPTSS